MEKYILLVINYGRNFLCKNSVCVARKKEGNLKGLDPGAYAQATTEGTVAAFSGWPLLLSVGPC